MKIALFGGNIRRFRKVFTDEILGSIRVFGDVTEVINKKNLEKNREALSECEVAFATWGMPSFTKEEIREYMPSLKAVFYAAGTVQYFARPFLDCGVRIFSAAAVNAVPVAEYTFSQIVLASKGFFGASRLYKCCFPASYITANRHTGNYDCTVGLVGLGGVGSAVAKRLQTLDCRVLAYDPFVSEERARELGVSLVSLDELFSSSDVISNHLPDKKELKNIFSYRLFRKMKKHSTFINTGRGGEVSETALALSLLLHPSRAFVGDVIKSEYFPLISPLFWCPNASLTPHIAGSTGNEPKRMAYAMCEELERFLAGEELFYEVTLPMLEKTA